MKNSKKVVLAVGSLSSMLYTPVEKRIRAGSAKQDRSSEERLLLISTSQQKQIRKNKKRRSDMFSCYGNSYATRGHSPVVSSHVSGRIRAS